MVDFDWDPKKEKQNIKKHGICFSEAVTVFYDPGEGEHVRIISARKASRNEIADFEEV